MAAKRTIRDLRIAARDGDPAAMRSLLRLYGKRELAARIRRNKPVHPRARTMILALTAGTGTHDELNRWEYRNEAGEIVNLLQHDPPSPIFED
jgi:hypothetical protein